MVRAFVISLLLSLAIIGGFFLTLGKDMAASDITHQAPWWSVQSIDTMKYSRDLSREKKKDPSFDAVIDKQMGNIAKTGATHVSIATPYDEEFVPVLARWVSSARKHNLSVWFRGNFSGWEKWFDYPAISRDEHIALLPGFISRHADLFREGDIFTSCPECENGGPGDPRVTKDISGHRLFLIREYDVATKAFREIGINVSVGYFSMNYDVARAIMDKSTTSSLGGIVTIDHYVQTPEKMIQDIRSLAEDSGGKIFLGEFGAPIPDIHGAMSESEQNHWLTSAFSQLAREPNIIGINYWVNVGGSTGLWDKNGNAKEAVTALSRAFRPALVRAKIVDQFNNPITNAEVASTQRKTLSDKSGQFILPYLPGEKSIQIKKDNYIDMTINIDGFDPETNIVIEKINITVIDRLLGYIRALISNLR